MSSKAPGISLSREEILGLVQSDLVQVEAGLRVLTDSALPIINDINQYLHESGGKRLRPAVLLLCSRLCGYQGKAAIRLGEVVELIHVATLVHDDIIDNSDIRRGRPSVNAHWGNQVTVLVGDWMYMTAFQLALRLQNFKVLEILIDVTRGMVEGELLQLARHGDLQVSAEEHIQICTRKTARLFQGCGQLASVVAGADAEMQQRLSLYGHSLGLAFQLTDDLLDYTATAAKLGKPVLKDLEEGKITLPIIYLLDRASAGQKSFLCEVIEQRDFSSENKQRIMQLAEEYNTLRDVAQLARHHADQAVAALEDLPAGTYRDALLSLPHFVVNRQQ